MAARRKLGAVPDPVAQPVPPDLRVSVAASIAGMTWTTDTDEALKTLALLYAQQIETAVLRADELCEAYAEVGGDQAVFKRLQKLEAMCDVTKTIGWLGPQLQGVLRDLGGNPTARKLMKSDAPIGGRLAALRKAREVGAGGVGGSEGVDSPEA